MKENLWFDDGVDYLTPLSKYINNKEIYISEIDWNNLKDTYSRQELQDFFIAEVLNKRINLPLRKCTVYDAIKSFNDLLNYDTKGLLQGKVYTKSEYKYKIEDLYLDEPVVGNIASDYFNQEARMNCGSQYHKSPIDVWNDEKELKNLIGGVFTLNTPGISTNILRSVLGMRSYVASQFKPAVAKAIYEMFNAEDVLDFSAGWGDRLCGFYAAKCTKTYVGIDPNTAVYNNYFKQKDLYSSLTSNKCSTFINSPAEDVLIHDRQFDLVFTSPPYFNTEKYCKEDTQSYIKYGNNVQEWLNGFLFKAVDNAWKALKPGGHLVINIADTKTNGKYNVICDPMNDYIKSLGGKYIMGFGMKMAAKPNTNAVEKEDDYVFVEPVWVWEKQYAV